MKEGNESDELDEFDELEDEAEETEKSDRSGGQKEEVDYEKLLKECPEIGRELAKKYIKQFFEGEQHHSGGPIPDCILLTERNIQMVIDLNICDGVQRAYDLLESSSQPIPKIPEVEINLEKDIPPEDIPDDEPDFDDSLFPSDVQLVVGLIHRCKNKGIPQPFVAGLFCIYLEVCCGIELPKFKDEDS
jgi:hypothetical protein